MNPSHKKNWIILLTEETDLPSYRFERSMKKIQGLAESFRIFCATSAKHPLASHPLFFGRESLVFRTTTAPFERGNAWQALLALLEILREDPEGKVILLPVSRLVESEERVLTALQNCLARAGDASREILLLGFTPQAPELLRGGDWLLPSGIPQGGVYPEVCTRFDLSLTEALEISQKGGLQDPAIWFGASSTVLLAYSLVASEGLRPFYERMVSQRPCADFKGLNPIYAGLSPLDLSRDLINGAPDYFRAMAVPSAKEPRTVSFLKKTALRFPTVERLCLDIADRIGA